MGERAPSDIKPLQEVEVRLVAELKLKLSNASIQTAEGKRRVTAMAQLFYDPADSARHEAESRTFRFTAPLGPIEADDLRWYLESYYLWPSGTFTERAKRIEAQLPKWGQDLYQAATVAQSARDLLADWHQTAKGIERRFSVHVDHRLPEGSCEEEQVASNEAASALLSLPWELLHDDEGYLFQGMNAVRVRRRLPKQKPQPANPARLPIRILLVSPRPEDEQASYIDHRISARPLMEAIESLGELAELTVLNPPTFAALKDALRKSAKTGKPFDVVHFDSHGVYDREHGLGGLCFEDPKDGQKLEKRSAHKILAKELAAEFRAYRVPLVFLEACESAKTEESPTASVAAKLLEGGVSSVIAMSHSVLVETARRFVTAFYKELATGERVGTAMLAGQQALYGDTYRGKIMGAGELHLHDWFVPVLYQEEQDPQLITKKPPKEVQQLQAKQRRLSFGALPDTPKHSFIGRSRELLALERLLHNQPSYAVVCGQGGAGKTTLAVELARWLVRTNRFRRAAFVSLEQYTDARGVLDELGRQLLPEGDNWSVAQYSNLKQALQSVERALGDHPTIIVLDNIESVLPGNFPSPLAGEGEGEGETFQAIAQLCQHLLHADPATRLVFTSRESLPEPFNHKHREIGLGALSREDAKALVSHVLAQEGLIPNPNDPDDKEEDIIELVEAVNRHARALVLLAPELASRGVRATTENLHQIMADLDKKHPDDRENSLYASVELSLRRLPLEMWEQVKALAVFHGGAHLYVLGKMLETDAEAVRNLANALIEVGLAEAMDYGHLQ
ncbi:MAG: CHAT domain-containing protein, partial [Pseudomonadota bacterium]|nr:CHAT domain-containing protein [Pseudomonadota bacterium]